jgi:hypothetical protein
MHEVFLFGSKGRLVICFDLLEQGDIFCAFRISERFLLFFGWLTSKIGWIIV